jgi:3-oxoadipate enol-lactonase
MPASTEASGTPSAAARTESWTDREVVVPGRGRISIREVRGPADAPTLVLLHGLAATGRLNWFTALPALAARFNVVVLDHRGHGGGIRTRNFRLAD